MLRRFPGSGSTDGSGRACLTVLILGLTGCSSIEEPPRIPAPDRVVRVPAEAATIQGGIDRAVAGDTVLLAPGIYSGPGNRNIDFRGKSITVRSERGPADTIVDCGGEPGDSAAGFLFTRGESAAVIEGLTIRRARAAMGAAVYCYGTSPTLRDCLLADNEATDSGGALRCKNSSPLLENCTIVQNGSPAGGAVYLIARSSPRFVRCLIAFSTRGGSVVVRDSGSQPVFDCCDIHGNEGGDWIDEIAAQEDQGGNLNVDPQFCSVMDGDFGLRPSSPCAPANNDCAVRIGALGVGCPPAGR